MGTLAGWMGRHRVWPARTRRRMAGPASLDFRRLVGEAAWSRLPLAVRERFGLHRLGEEIIYPGEMIVRASRFGRFLAQACRLIGTPLAPWTGEVVPMRVVVRMEAGRP